MKRDSLIAELPADCNKTQRILREATHEISVTKSLVYKSVFPEIRF